MNVKIYGALVQFGCYQHRYMNGRVCGASVQFSCYQHKHKWTSSAKPWSNMLLLVLVFYTWRFNYPGRLLEHQFGYGIVYHPQSWSEIAWVSVRNRGSVARAPAAKAGGPGFDSRWLPWVFFFSSSWLTNVDGMKDLWCSSTVQLLSTQIWMERSIVL